MIQNSATIQKKQSAVELQNPKAPGFIGQIKFLGIIVLAFSPLVGVGAEVNLRNGNYFTSSLDLDYSAGFAPRILRVYNSKSSFKGIFGWGWGSEYEAYLTLDPDGSLVSHGFGSGNEDRYVPMDYSDSRLKEAVDRLLDAAKKTGSLGSDVQAQEYKSKLQTNVQFRMEQWDKYHRLGKIEANPIKTGTQFKSLQLNYLFITKIADGYVRKSDTGKTEIFSDTGRLKRIQDTNGNSLDFKYSKDGHIEKIVDNFNRKIFFEFNDKGHVSKIEGEDGKTITYQYNDEHELISSKSSGATYAATYAPTYTYDKLKRHLLTKITANGHLISQVEYFGPDKNENVKKVIKPAGVIEEYDYKKLPDGNAVIFKSHSGGKTNQTAEYEYHVKHRVDGQEWVHRLVATSGGSRIETTYDEHCGLPTAITMGKQTASFVLDEKCRVLSKITPSEVRILTYHPSAGQVSYSATYTPETSPAQRKLLKWSKFNYDPKGNVSLAEGSNGKKVTLVYDFQGRLKILKDQDRRQISFEYNETSKPSKITDSRMGAMVVEYNKSGEVIKLDSPQGKKIEAEVAKAFQSLHTILADATVSLSF